MAKSNVIERQKMRKYVLKNKWLILIIMMILFICCIFIRKSIIINKKFPSRQIINVDKGKIANIKKGISFCVSKTVWMDNHEFIKKYGKNADVNQEESKIIFVDVLLENQDNSVRELTMSDISFEMLGYCNGLCMDTFLQFGGNMEVKLKQNEKKHVTLIYQIYKFQFTDEQWKNVEKERSYLVKDRYPTKICWEI